MNQPQRPLKRLKSDTVSSDQLQRYRNEAITLFKQQKYIAALKAFDKCIALDPHLLTLRDQRAATLEKLDNIKEAVREGQTMISMAPNRAMGYLRVGKCFQLSNRLDMAHQVYEAGLNAVAIDDTWRPKLISVADELYKQILTSKQQSASSSVDLTQKLPIELQLLILRYLPTNQRICCMRVCTLWHRIIKTTPAFWTTIDLRTNTAISRSTTRPLQNHQVELAISQCRHRLVTLRLPRSPQLSSGVLRSLARHMSGYGGLRHLELTPSAKISEESFIAALQVIGPKLEELILHAYGNWARHAWSHCPRLLRLETAQSIASMLLDSAHGSVLTTLRLIDCTFMGDQSITWIAKGFPRLQTLDIPPLSLQTARSTAFNATTATTLTIRCLISLCELTELTTLRLPGIHQTRGSIASTTTAIATLSNTLRTTTPSLPLSSIDLSSSTALSNDILSDMISAWHTTLQSVSLNRLPDLSDTMVATIVSMCPLLEHLHVGQCPRITDALLLTISTEAYHLQDLSLHANPSISNQGILQLFTPDAVCRHSLSHLDLSACPRVTSNGIEQLVETLEQHSSSFPYQLQWISLYNCQNVNRISSDRLRNVLKSPATVVYGFSDI
ncbi:hypothetical protein BDF22DRAFT_691502 [Syncephalis plumigaleata]|nr:hypothetical protein BDF22DRAFT_691502 [Syncephalis plumigaleata]